MKRRVGQTGLTIAALTSILLVIAARLVAEARSELSAGDSFLAQGKHPRAIDHYRRTLRWSFPFSPHAESAKVHLEEIAKQQEAAGDRSTALLAWRSLLGGLSASRAMYARSDGAARRAKQQIARLMAVERSPVDTGSGPDDLAAFHRELLDREIAPDALWGTFLLLGFAIWVGSLVLLIDRGFDASGRPHWPCAGVPLGGALIGFTAFVLGLMFA